MQRGVSDQSDRLNPSSVANTWVLTSPDQAVWGPCSALLSPFLGEGSPTKIEYRKKSGTLILTSPLEDLVARQFRGWFNKKR